MTAHMYSPDFFRRHAGGAISSARAVVPFVLELVGPKSVVDVGCGVGAWLSVFREYGVTDVMGIDGPCVCASQLVIPHECFIRHDLEQPIALTRRFDLAVSLEVAEHVSRAAADTFAASLARLAPAVLFSAAIPKQGGEHHVNEQWPAWRTRRLMETDSVDYGPAASAEPAVAQVEKHRKEGASFIVIAFSAFWWLEHYAAFAAHLHSSSHCVLANDNLIVFDLRREPQQSAD